MSGTNKMMDYIIWIIAILIVIVMFTNNPIMTKLDEWCKQCHVVYYSVVMCHYRKVWKTQRLSRDLPSNGFSIPLRDFLYLSEILRDLPGGGSQRYLENHREPLRCIDTGREGGRCLNARQYIEIRGGYTWSVTYSIVLYTSLIFPMKPHETPRPPADKTNAL